MLRIIIRIIAGGVTVFVIFFVTALGFFYLTKDNRKYNYFEIKNNTKANANMALYYAEELYITKSIAPLEIEEVKTFTNVRGGLKFLITKNNGVEVSREYYIIFGKSFFFKTRYLLEYDGEKIKEIYARKIDCGIFCIFYDENEIVPR